MDVSQYLGIFLDEAKEHIQVLSDQMLILEQEPDNQDFSDVAELDTKGYVIADESCRTKTTGIFVAGDCRSKYVRQLTTAVADGAVAALAACRYLSSGN